MGRVGYCGAKWETHPLLLGESVQKLDAKNRVTLPAQFRGHFADGVVITKGFDSCLSVFNRDGWEAFAGCPAGPARSRSAGRAGR